MTSQELKVTLWAAADKLRALLRYSGATGVSRIRLDGEAKPKVQKLPALASVLVSRKWGIGDGGLYYVDFYDDERKLRWFDLRT